MKYHRDKTKKYYQIVQDEQTIKQKNAKRQISETHLFTRSSLMCSVLGTDHVGPVIGASVSVSLAQMVYRPLLSWCSLSSVSSQLHVFPLLPGSLRSCQERFSCFSESLPVRQSQGRSGSAGRSCLPTHGIILQNISYPMTLRQ